MYCFKTVDGSLVNQFNSKHGKGHILQTEYWAKLKKDWVPHYLGGYDSTGDLVLTCTLLARKMPVFNQWIGYIPRGFTCDYLNEDLVKSFSRYLRSYARKLKIAFIAMDPDIHLSDNMYMNEQGKKVREILRKAGYTVRSSQDFGDFQPNYVFRLSLPEGLEPERAKKVIFDHFSEKTRYNIRVAMRRGLKVEKYDASNVNDFLLDIFQELMNVTGKRDRFITRQKPYFSAMLKELYPHCRLYLVRYDPEEDAARIMKKIQTLQGELVDIQKERNETGSRDKDADIRLQEIQSQLRKQQEKLEEIKPYLGRQDMYLSGAIYLNYNNKAWYLYGASDNVLRDTMPNYLMQWKMIQDSIEDGCILYDFRGVSGSLNPKHPLYGLYKFKKGFGGDFVEFIGLQCLVTNKPVHLLCRTALPVYRKVRRVLATNSL